MLSRSRSRSRGRCVGLCSISFAVPALTLLLAASLKLELEFHAVSVFAACSVNDFGVPNGKDPSATPSPQALVMWVSSSGLFTGNLGGRAGANALCTAMHPSKVPSQALLSYSDQNAIDAIPADVDIVNTRGGCIAANREDLFKGLQLAGLVYDEDGDAPPSNINVFTATTSDGYKAGLGFNKDAGEYVAPDPFPDKYCDDFTSTSASTVSSLGKLEVGADLNSQWVQFDIQDDAEGQCSAPNHIYCITSAPAPTQSTTTESTVARDPQFVGLQGQRFQVHGIPEEYFNLVSHPFFQLNSHFTYLATGTCNYNDTSCWSHPGTYVDELGLMLPGYEIGIFAGEHQHGLTVTVNGRTIVPATATATGDGAAPFHARFPLRIDNDTIDSMSHHTHWLEPQTTTITTTTTTTTTTTSSDTSDAHHSSSSSWLLSCHVSVSLLSPVHVVIDTPVATLDIYNADHFFNFAVELRAPRLLLAGAPLDRVGSPTRGHGHAHTTTAGSHASKSSAASASISPATSPHPIFPMHGLVGQTWKNVKYPHGRLYAGEVDDYMLSDRRLFSTNFVYNEYQY